MQAGDDAKVIDELGDVLFQVLFLSLLLEERGAGDLDQVADHCARKLVRRHPHVFGEAEAQDAAAVLRNWDRIKREEEGRDTDDGDALPSNLPATIYAGKVQRRAADAADGGAGDGPQAALERLAEAARALAAAGSGERDDAFEPMGEVLYSAVAAARSLQVDAELALREAANRRRERARVTGGAR